MGVHSIREYQLKSVYRVSASGLHGYMRVLNVSGLGFKRVPGMGFSGRRELCCSSTQPTSEI